MKVKKLLSTIFSIITALIFIVGLFIFICVLRANAGQVPSVLGYSVMRIQTGSMTPEYEIGSIVITKKTDAKSLKVGDVISFYSNDSGIANKVNTHRIIEIKYNMAGSEMFITKGDANDLADDTPVLERKIIGRVIKNFGVVTGSFVEIIQNPKVIFFCIVLPLIVITFFEAVNVVNLFVKKNTQEEEDNEKDSDES